MLLIEQKHACYYCGGFIAIKADHPKHKATADHKTPLYRGGDPFGENVAAACSYCNNLKGPLSEAEFLFLREDAAALARAKKLCTGNPDFRPMIRRLHKQQAVNHQSKQRLYERLQGALPRSRKIRLSDEQLGAVLTRATASLETLRSLMDSDTQERFAAMFTNPLAGETCPSLTSDRKGTDL